MCNTLKNNKGSSTQAAATETGQQENMSEESHDNVDDTEEWNETYLFTQ
jgi:hypothetical protein